MLATQRSFQLEAALNAAYNAIIIIDRDAKVIFANRAAEEIIGIPVIKILWKHIKDVVPNTQLDKVLVDGKPSLHNRVTINEHVIITNRTPILRDGEVVGAVAVFQDITKLQKALKELDSARDMLAMLETGLEHVSDGIVMVDKEGHITMMTDAYARFLGVDLDEVVGKHVTEVIENTRMHIVLKTGKAEIGEIQRIKGRDTVVMRIPIKSSGEVIGGIGQVMFQDVSDLKKLAERLHLAESKLEYYKQEYKRWQRSRYNFSSIVGESSQITLAKELAQRVAKSRSTVLIQGESGTGKELLAHAIHGASPRQEQAFIRVNCAAIPKDLLEAELFGYEEGAFTGAKKGGKPGKIKLADKGTIFLDEIGDMPMEMQMKLLRVLQEREVEKIGSTAVEKVDIRVIAATNRDLQRMVAEGTFRKDLYYRLNVVNIYLPPLREHPEDIPLLMRRLIEKLNRDLGTAVSGVSAEVEELFLKYNWPGNVRELENILERAMNVMEGSVIKLKDLPIYLQDYELTGSSQIVGETLEQELELAEKRAIKRALKYAKGNKNKAAKLLNIHRATLYRKIEKYQLDV